MSRYLPGRDDPRFDAESNVASLTVDRGRELTAKQFRRVVTGLNKDRRSIVEIDGPPGPADSRGASMEMWATDSSPADNGAAGDAADRPVRLEP